LSEVEEVVEEKPIKLTIESATEPIEQEAPVFSIEEFTQNIKSPDFNDLTTEQKLKLQEYENLKKNMMNQKIIL
jgi:hypothetical protein